MWRHRPVPPRADHPVAYLTDVEGEWTRIATFCEHNPHVWLDAAGHLQLAPDVTFVFGGDAIDRGPDARRVVRELLDVKERHAERVVLLAGNRDLNKMRLARELSGHPHRRMPAEMATASLPEQLRFIFQHTMGAAGAFEHRRTELISEGRAASDDDVTGSFLHDLGPDGDLSRFYRHAQLAFRSGRTLFVHGGVAEEALTMVPRRPTRTLAAFDVDLWVEDLHTFYAEQIGAYDARALEPDGTPMWQSAILYQAPRKGLRSNPGSVVYGRLADRHNNLRLPQPSVMDALLRCGVSRVVVGHTPSGDIPSVVRGGDGARRFEVVCADNSRSRVQSGTRLLVRDAEIDVAGRCVLDGGSVIAVTQTLAFDDDSHHGRLIGRVTSDGALVKAKHDDQWLVFRFNLGFEVTQELRSELGPLTEPMWTDVMFQDVSS